MSAREVPDMPEEMLSRTSAMPALAASLAARIAWTPKVGPTTRPISTKISASSTTDSPLPPTSSGKAMLNQPRSANFWRNSRRGFSDRALSCNRVRDNSRSRKVEACAIICCCSSLGIRSIGRPTIRSAKLHKVRIGKFSLRFTKRVCIRLHRLAPWDGGFG